METIMRRNGRNKARDVVGKKDGHQPEDYAG
jgi:hypothetical protein